MLQSLNLLIIHKPQRFGVLLAFVGVLILTPDTLVIRLSELERWSLMGWRGFLMGLVSLLLWRFFLSQNPSREWRSLATWQGLIVIFAFGVNSATFTLGIVETSATVVLTAVATMPIFAAILSFFMLGERQGMLGWLAILAAMGGVFVVVLDGGNAVGGPDGSVALGASLGVLTALGLAFTFTMSRKYHELGILPAASLGAMICGGIGLYIGDINTITQVPLWPVLTMGMIILPISFTCLNLAPRYTTSAIVSLLMLLEMVIGPFWVWLGVGEQPTIIMISGAAFVALVLAMHILRSQWPSES
ncbi:DMT family transporter [Candidatus Puniceispirillum sp.]|nr:DMT family transporter [Candidatus Puniceispirillum sp.]